MINANLTELTTKGFLELCDKIKEEKHRRKDEISKLKKEAREDELDKKDDIGRSIASIGKVVKVEWKGGIEEAKITKISEKSVSVTLLNVKDENEKLKKTWRYFHQIVGS